MKIQFSQADEIFTPLINCLELEPTDNTFKTIKGQVHHSSGVITATTTKLPNCIFNLKQALTEIKLSDIKSVKSYTKVDWATLLDAVLASSVPPVYLAIFFLKQFINSLTIEVTETDALVLHTLWEVANSGLPGRVISRSEFQKSAPITKLETEALQQSLEHLTQLRCIQVEADKIILTEQIIFEKVHFNGDL